MRRMIVLFLLVTFSVVAQEKGKPQKQLPNQPPPLKTVDAHLAQAQEDFDIARRMFNPWYAGPLLTPSAQNVPPGSFVVQPYLFVKNTYAEFNSNRKSVNTPNLWTVQPVFLFQMGWFNWLDFTIIAQGFYNKKSGEDFFFWGDTQLEWGIQMIKESPYKPAVRMTITETFPTGRYEKLNPGKNGTDSTGAGAYTTTLSLNVSKVFWWITTHPFAWRLSMNYGIPNSPVHVQGLNTYGGGYKTRGKVRPGNSIAVDTSIELSFTQKWVLSIDLAYTYQNHSTFSGHKGRTTSGTTASVGSPSNDNLSCSPAIEYNPSDHMGFVAGAWFSITGRNSGDFVAGILTMYYSW